MTQEKEKDNNYEYYKYIKTPKEMDIEAGDGLSNVRNGVAGIFNYIKLLVEGKTTASKTGKPLGNKFFLETSQDCIDKITGSTKKRSLYFDNVPSGNLGMFKDTGTDFTDFKGLIPGAIEDVMAIGQIDFFSVFTEVDPPKCLSVKLKTIDVDNKEGSDTQYVTVSDIKNINACNFVPTVSGERGRNPETEITCKTEGFISESYFTNEEKNNANLYKNYYKLDDDEDDNNVGNDNQGVKLRMPDDIFLRILFYSFGALAVYVALKMMANMYKKRN